MDPVLAKRIAEQHAKANTGKTSMGSIGSQADKTIKLDPVLARRMAEQQRKAQTGESSVDNVGSQAYQTVKLDPVLAKRIVEQHEKASTGRSSIESGKIGSCAQHKDSLNPLLATRMAAQREKEANQDAARMAAEQERLAQEEAARAAAELAKIPKVLVLGGTGILGRPLVAELSRRGLRVTALSSTSYGAMPQETAALMGSVNCDHVHLDVADDITKSGGMLLRETVQANNFRVVVNLVSNHGGEWPEAKERQLLHPNLNTDLQSCLEALAEECGTKVIHISRESNWSSDAHVLRECDEGTAAAAELTTRIRVPALFGPLVRAGEGGMAAAAVSNFLKGNTWDYDDAQQRYPTRASDCAFVLGALVEKALRTDLSGRSYVYGSQHGLTAFGFMEMFSRATDLPIERLRRDVSDSDVHQDAERPATALLRAELGEDWREPAALSDVDFWNIWAPYYATQIEELKRRHAQLPHAAVKIFSKPTERDGVTFFALEVALPRTGVSYTVERRYREFEDLRQELMDLGKAPSANFPRKHITACVGTRLQHRISTLEVWLQAALEASLAGEAELGKRLASLPAPLAQFLEISSTPKRSPALALAQHCGSAVVLAAA